MTHIIGQQRRLEAEQRIDAEILTARVNAELDQIAADRNALAGATNAQLRQIMDRVLARQAGELRALRFTVRAIVRLMQP